MKNLYSKFITAWKARTIYAKIFLIINSINTVFTTIHYFKYIFNDTNSWRYISIPFLDKFLKNLIIFDLLWVYISLFFNLIIILIWLFKKINGKTMRVILILANFILLLIFLYTIHPVLSKIVTVENFVAQKAIIQEYKKSVKKNCNTKIIDFNNWVEVKIYFSFEQIDDTTLKTTATVIYNKERNLKLREIDYIIVHDPTKSEFITENSTINKGSSLDLLLSYIKTKNCETNKSYEKLNSKIDSLMNSNTNNIKKSDLELLRAKTYYSQLNSESKNDPNIEYDNQLSKVKSYIKKAKLYSQAEMITDSLNQTTTKNLKSLLENEENNSCSKLEEEDSIIVSFELLNLFNQFDFKFRLFSKDVRERIDNIDSFIQNLSNQDEEEAIDFLFTIIKSKENYLKDGCNIKKQTLIYLLCIISNDDYDSKMDLIYKDCKTIESKILADPKNDMDIISNMNKSFYNLQTEYDNELFLTDYQFLIDLFESFNKEYKTGIVLNEEGLRLKKRLKEISNKLSMSSFYTEKESNADEYHEIRLRIQNINKTMSEI